MDIKIYSNEAIVGYHYQESDSHEIKEIREKVCKDKMID